MKRQKLALLLAAILMVTSLDSTAMLVSGAEFSAEAESVLPEEMTSEESETFTAESEEAEETQEETAEFEFSDETENLTDSNEETEEKNSELNIDEEIVSDENNEQEETVLFSGEEDFSSETVSAERSAAGIEDADVLEPGKEYTVSLSDDDSKIWFSYIPEDTGDYTIWSESDRNVTPSVTLYVWDENSRQLSYLGYNFQTKDNYDFCLKSELEKDRIYYYCIEYYGTYSEASFTIDFVKTPEIQTVNVDFTNAKNQFNANMDECYVRGAKLYVTYMNGKSDEITFEENWQLYDRYGNKYDYILEKTNAVNKCYYPGDTLPAGIYYVKFKCNEEIINSTDTYQAEVQEMAKENLTALKAGVNKGIETSDNDWKWYTFTPEISGKYYFAGFYLMRSVYQDSNGITNKNNYYGTSSYIYMNEQTEYRLGFKKNSDAEDGSSDMITLTIKNVTVSEIICSPENIVLNRALEGADKDTVVPGCDLTWIYADGTQSKKEDVKLGESFYDNYHNAFMTKIVDTATNETFVYSYEHTELPDGTYKLSFVCDNVVSNEVTMKVVPVELSALRSIKMGMNTVKAGEYDSYRDRMSGVEWCLFTPDESGSYYFDAEAGKYLTVFTEGKELDEQGELKDLNPEGNAYTLEAGKNYIFGWYIESYEYSSQEAAVDVRMVPEIKSVRLMSYEPKNMSFIEKMDTVKLNSCKVEVTYKDEQKEVYSLYYHPQDIYGRELTWTIYDSDGKTCDYDQSEIPAGDYKIKVSFGGVEADNSIDVKVTSVNALEAVDLSSGSAELGENDEKILKYKPSTDGCYQFEFNTALKESELSIITSEGNEVDDVSKTAYMMEVNLKQDTEYYIRIATDKNVKVTASLYVYVKPVKLKAIMKRKTSYIPGIDSVRERDLQTEITYEDGSVSMVDGAGDVAGYCLKYKIEERNEDISSYPIESGNWHIVPYLSNYYDGDMSDDAVIDDEPDLDIETEAAELKATMPEDDQFQNIKEDEWAFAGGEGGYYIFTPEEDGVFGFTGSEEQELDSGFAIVYEKKANKYHSINTSNFIEMQAGKTYLVEVHSDNAGKFKIKKYTIPDEIEQIKPISELTLQTGMEETVRVKRNGNYGYLICRYTPEEDGYYELRCESWKDKYDCSFSYIELFSDGEYISSNGSGITEMSAGKTYTYEFRKDFDVCCDAPFVLKFNKIPKNAIKSADLILKDGKQASDFRMEDGILDVYDLKIDYMDGTSKVLTSGSMDEFGNSISLDYDFSGNIAQDEIDCNVSICYTNQGEKEKQKICKTIKAKAVGSFEEIELGKEYAIDGKTAYYKFVPEEDGYYTYRRTGYKFDMWDYTYFRMLDGRNIYGTKVGKGTYSAYLRAGEMYYLKAQSPKKETLKLVKDKTLKGLEVVNAPTQKCFRDGVDSIAYGSLKLKAFYTDGSTEEILYGERDSSGREIYTFGEWMKNGNYRVYVRLGEYRTSFDVEPASEDEIQTLTVGEINEVRASANDAVTLKFTPQKTRFYQIYITNGTGVKVEYEYYPADLAYYSPCRLNAGETYYIHITAEADDPTVCIAPMVCDTHIWGTWKTVKAATCTAVGSEMRECTVCGEQETRTTPIQATGAHKMGSWKVIKEATALSTGIQERTCSICGGAKETKSVAKLTPKLTLNTGINTTVPLKAKQTLQVRATGLAKGDKVASWKSSNTKIVTVSGSGKLTAKKAGTATVTVKLQSGLSKSFKVKVQNSAVKTTKISGLKSKVTVQKGKKLTLKPVISPTTSKEKVTYSSSDKKIATVSSKGVITAKKAGTAKITVKSGSKKFTVKVTVPKTKTTALKASASVTVKKGKTVTLKVTKTPSNSDESITYTSSDKKIATVDKKGKIKGVKKGTATITAKSGSITKKIKVTVK